MNICLIHFTTPSVVGGVEKIIEQHAKIFFENGHKVSLIAGRGEKCFSWAKFSFNTLCDSKGAIIEKCQSDLNRGIITEDFRNIKERIYKFLMPILKKIDIAIVHNVCSLNKNLMFVNALYDLYKDGEIKSLILWHHDLSSIRKDFDRLPKNKLPWKLLCCDWNGIEATKRVKEKFLHVVVSNTRKKERIAFLMAWA